MDPHVVVVILNTNRRADVLSCLDSLVGGAYGNRADLVLDNASVDGSSEAIRELFPHAQVIPLAENRGYAGNNNLGIRKALKQGAEWVFLLNEDTILSDTCLNELIEVAKLDSSIGILGPMVYHFDEPGVIQSAGGYLSEQLEALHYGQNELDRSQFANPREVDWVTGCSILVRREVLEHVGMLDERFFYYWEETDLCWRARNSGWKVVHVPQAKLWHKGVQRSYAPSPMVTYYSTRNRFLLMKKHHAPFSAWAKALAITCRTLASWTFRGKWRSKSGHRNAMWRGTIDFIRRRWGRMPS